MKLDQLRTIIREEVKSAIKEELQDMLNEAVKAASTPTKQTQTTYTPVTQKDISKTWSTGKINQGTVPLEEMINQTKSEMTNEDYKTIINANSTSAPNFAQRQATGGGGAGLDLSTIPGFDPNKAKAILDKANESSKQRAGA